MGYTVQILPAIITISEETSNNPDGESDDNTCIGINDSLSIKCIELQTDGTETCIQINSVLPQISITPITAPPLPPVITIPAPPILEVASINHRPLILNVNIDEQGVAYVKDYDIITIHIPLPIHTLRYVFADSNTDPFGGSLTLIPTSGVIILNVGKNLKGVEKMAWLQAIDINTGAISDVGVIYFKTMKQSVIPVVTGGNFVLEGNTKVFKITNHNIKWKYILQVDNGQTIAYLANIEKMDDDNFNIKAGYIAPNTDLIRLMVLEPLKSISQPMLRLLSYEKNTPPLAFNGFFYIVTIISPLTTGWSASYTLYIDDVTSGQLEWSGNVSTHVIKANMPSYNQLGVDDKTYKVSIIPNSNDPRFGVEFGLQVDNFDMAMIREDGSQETRQVSFNGMLTTPYTRELPTFDENTASNVRTWWMRVRFTGRFLKIT